MAVWCISAPKKASKRGVRDNASCYFQTDDIVFEMSRMSSIQSYVITFEHPSSQLQKQKQVMELILENIFSFDSQDYPSDNSSAALTFVTLLYVSRYCCSL